MKMSKINRAILALALAFSLTVPAFAAGGETAPAPEEQPPVQTPEVPDEADPEPPTWLVTPAERTRAERTSRKRRRPPNPRRPQKRPPRRKPPKPQKIQIHLKRLPPPRTQ